MDVARKELHADMDKAQDWYCSDVKDPANSARAKQLRYSLCNKLAADWQKFVKARCAAEGVPTDRLGNCWPSQVRKAYAQAGKDDPFARVAKSDLDIFSEVNPVRNKIDHGEEPPVPENSDLERWLAGLRRIADGYNG